MTSPEERGPDEYGPQFHHRSVDGARQERRSFSEIPAKRGRLTDVDVQDLNVRFKAIMAAGPGAIMGGFLGYYLVAKHGFGVWIVPVCMLAMGLFVTLMTLFVVNRAAAAGGNIYAPTGKTTPRKKEYSYAESLAIRGEYEAAVDAFELAIVEEDPTDPTPYLRIAQIYRDKLERYEDAARWLRRGIADSAMHSGLVALTRKELVELYRTKLNQPEKAAPMLARLAEELAGTPDGDWAAEELRYVKELMQREREP